MSMSKKDFIKLADQIRLTNEIRRNSNAGYGQFTDSQIGSLADFCEQQNPNFNRERWLAYIAGECGPSGGTVKKAADKFAKSALKSYLED